MKKITLVLISSVSSSVARILKSEFPDATLISTQDIPDCHQVASYESYLSEHFHEQDAFIFIGAMGICVRLISPWLRDKYTDPAVVCVDGTARYVIPVVSGHVGQANELAKWVSRILGAEAVITTLSDRLDLWALDTWSEKYSWSLVSDQSASHETMNRCISLFVNRHPTLLYISIDLPEMNELLQTCPEHVLVCRERPSQEMQKKYGMMIVISPYLEEEISIPHLQFVPRVLCAGIGLAHEAGPVDGVMAEWQHRVEEAGFERTAIQGFATIDVKRHEPVVKRLQEIGYPVHFYSADELKQVEVPTPSVIVEQHVGTPSVAEAAAMLLARGGELVMEKKKGSNYTLALALDSRIKLSQRGHIEIVGAGPGDPDLISVRGRRMLEKADLILYAGSLVPRELTLCAKPGAVVRSSASMNLDEQFALMKKFYDQHAFIVRLHTGDPCIYGAIEEQMNYFDQYGMEYHITPGISSFQAAAAELRSQFTIPERVQTIILTRGEGRTPMPDREKLHLLARSRSTMCIFLSASIADKVQDELLQEYPAETPVAVCHHLTWKDQRIWRGELKNLAAMVRENKLTLTTMIVVGDAIDNRQGVSRLYADEFKHLYRK